MLCQQRKVRCDQQKPCDTCVRAKVECTVVPLLPPKPRRTRQSLDRAVMDRLHRCETLLAQHGVDVERELPGSSKESSSPASPGEGTPRAKWFPYYKEYQTTDELLRYSSDDESDQPTIHHGFDAMFDDSDGFPLVLAGSDKIASLHPPGLEILQLWQVYLQRVDPLLKITHQPTLQAQIVAASANPTAIPKPLEALMLAIYLISVHAMADQEVQEMFHEPKPRLLARYHRATQQALVNAAFMRSQELMVLQAYLLYLFSSSSSVDPRSLFCLVGIALRIATRLGLHRDCARFGVSPFETELRRRLWWQIVIFDARLAEMTGSPITALTTLPTDCCLPLNVNDPDLHPSAKEAPAPAGGASEMLFSLSRVELTVGPTATARARSGTSVEHEGEREGGGEKEKGTGLDGYATYIDLAYLQHCDPTIPIQQFTLLMARGTLCKRRIFRFMCRGVPSSTLSLPDRDALLLAAIQMVEYDTAVYTTSTLRGFRWYADLHVPMLGSIFIASELRLRPRGELCERAWKALSENQQQRGGGSREPQNKKRTSPMHAAFEHALLRAWEAYEQAVLQGGSSSSSSSSSSSQRQPPPLIVQIRAAREESHSETGSFSLDPTMAFDPMTAQLTPSSPFLFDGSGQGFGPAILDYSQLDWTYLMGGS
ncbi:hypothetical protein ASPZODRAFT_130139 [Penicilliopsis zonata CBS 506.65]|uniref:Zn(2)-C6 fungal-type domain-containing protein n=1 Tax=Penicilliopsis zonata CBS 506.65 TaxID=1073090 RepID=A0A1L9SLX1_9EURO|nr:hypothetical protein ASPZODRAFT_130139 [Penicilliopsis zonata CBS 506.65]OJJ48190.1 hypothetical protein ASPZODRAFT_130139 [Penicilliopsis zonata CBS 506.65]